MTEIWQRCDRSMTEIWQEYDKDMTETWQKYDRSMTGIWQKYDKDMGKQLVPQVSLQFTNLDAGNMFIILKTRLDSEGIWQRYDRDMTEIWQEYDRDMTEIWQEYDRSMTEIWQGYDRDSDKNMTWKPGTIQNYDRNVIGIMISSTLTLTTLRVSLIALALKSFLAMTAESEVDGVALLAHIRSSSFVED